ncbi:MAG: hypothetical protein JSR84_01045 [Proteobacteria bacterium]|nr:hypothetical protein [Pseudomonadota bacterium]
MTPLKLDDPLAAATPPPAPEERPAEKPAATPRPPRTRTRSGGGARKTAAASPQVDAPTDGEHQAWRSWGRGTRAQTYKLPDQLIEELDARTTTLNLPIGMTVAAAIVAALDLKDDELITLVERAEEARERGRRAARRLH